MLSWSKLSALIRKYPLPLILILLIIPSVYTVPHVLMVPENPSAKYAIACALGSHATTKNFENIVKYIGRLPGEFSILTVKGMNPEVMDCKAFGTWARENEDILLG